MLTTYAKLFSRAKHFSQMPARKRRACVDRQSRIAFRRGWRLRRRLIATYGARCMACGSTKHLTLDHIVPLSRGGLTHWNNAQLLCKSCNESKGVEIIDCRPTEN